MLISVLFGILPEIIYFYLFTKNILKINNKKTLLFMSILIIYILTILIVEWNIYLYILFDILIYLVLKKFYKGKITDFFLLIAFEVYLYLISCGCYYLIPNYIIAFIINRILLFLPLLYKEKLINIYEKYKLMWNKNDNMPIKSLTLRNISLITINTLLVLGYITLIYLANK